MKLLTVLSAGLLAVGLLVPAAPMEAQGPPGDQAVYRVTAVHPQSWIVTAQNLETGKQVKFKLSPRAFARKRFQAELGGRGPGQKFTVVAPRNEPLAGCCEMAEGGASDRPSGSSSRPSSADARRPPQVRSQPPSRSGPSGQGGWEIVSVDQKGWVVTARNLGSGETIRFRVDPQAFVGYEFRADLHELRQGQGFTLIGINAMPLGECCTLLEG